MSDKKRHRTINEILQYLKGEDSEVERHSLEREMEADPFFQEAMEGLERVTPDEAEADLFTLQHSLQRRRRRRRRRTWYSVAAAVASILVIGTIFLQIYDVNPTDSEEKGLLEEAAPGQVPGDAPAVTEEEPVDAPAVTEEEPVDVPAVSEEEPVDVPAVTEEEAAQSQPAEKGEKMRAEQAPEPISPAKQRAAEKAATDVVPSEKIEFVDREAEEAVPSVPPPTDAARAGRVNRRMEKSARPAPEPQPMETGQVEIVSVEAEAVAREGAKGRETPVAEEISGTVVSAEDRAPVAGAFLTLKGADAISISDMEGRFSIPVTQDSQTLVSARHPGMETRETRIPANEEVTIILLPESETDPDQSLYQAREIPGQPDQYQTGIQPYSPQPSGGYLSFYQYINEQRRIPSTEDEGTGGVVILNFTISSFGEIIDIVPVRSPGTPFTQEAIRLLKEGPPWIPAFDESGPVDQEVTLRIEIE